MQPWGAAGGRALSWAAASAEAGRLVLPGAGIELDAPDDGSWVVEDPGAASERIVLAGRVQIFVGARDDEGCERAGPVVEDGCPEGTRCTLETIERVDYAIACAEVPGGMFAALVTPPSALTDPELGDDVVAVVTRVHQAFRARAASRAVTVIRADPSGVLRAPISGLELRLGASTGWAAYVQPVEPVDAAAPADLLMRMVRGIQVGIQFWLRPGEPDCAGAFGAPRVDRVEARTAPSMRRAITEASARSS